MRSIVLGVAFCVCLGCDRNAAPPGETDNRNPTPASAPSSNNLPRVNAGGEARPVEPAKPFGGNTVSPPPQEPRTPVPPK